MNEVDKKTATIRLNDAFRRTFVGGRIVLTRGMIALDIELRREIIRAVQAYAAWESGNDQHDFGAVQIQGQKVTWKISYFDMQLLQESPDPSDPKVTRRELTIMLASDS